MEIRAAVLEQFSTAFQMQSLEMGEPAAGELLVEMVASGICHTDLAARDHFLPLPLPIILGHEGAGIVRKVGPGVKKFAPGARVVLSRDSCGDCRPCMAGDSNYCDNALPLNLSGRRLDGSTGLSRLGDPVFARFGGQSSFATHALVSQRSAVAVPDDIDLALAPAFACGSLTGAGTVIQGLKVRLGDSIAIFGAGMVGLTALMAAAAAGCSRTVVIDKNPERLKLAEQLGATDLLVSDGSGDLLARIMALLPRGANHSLDATGVATVVRCAVDCLAPGGTCALIGGPPAGTELVLDHLGMVLKGTSAKGYPTGECDPDSLLPILFNLYREGRFPVDQLVRGFAFDDIEAAFSAAARGEVVKPILRISAEPA